MCIYCIHAYGLCIFMTKIDDAMSQCCSVLCCLCRCYLVIKSVQIRHATVLIISINSVRLLLYKLRMGLLLDALLLYGKAEKKTEKKKTETQTLYTR